MYLILPTLALMLISFAQYTRYTRASMLDVMGQDYVRTARAKGLNNRTVVVRHAFRNALIPLATLMAFDFAGIFSGAIVTETVFGWSGMGKLFTTSLTHIDPNPVMAFFLVSATAIVIFNMLADIAYAYLDPANPIGVTDGSTIPTAPRATTSGCRATNVPAHRTGDGARFVGIDNELAEANRVAGSVPRRSLAKTEFRIVANASSGTRRPGPG